ncbi:MAG TPA: trehalose-phosphatase [Burkholderiaceae bacterium]|nr:trehalose-phosphatase [Burkholderiaceae bacterium]
MPPRPPTDAELPLLAADAALFLDFDGTLADLAPRPDAVHVPPSLIETLQCLQQALHGAVAVVSGRPLEQLDRLLHPLRLPLAGVHGVERRSADGYVQRLASPALDHVLEAAHALAARLPGLLVERKPGAVALHYRQAPELGPHCEAALRAAMHGLPGLTLLHGKMVLEVKPSHANKGHAIQAFLREPPFRGRQPLFAGDDVTDEDGFAAVQAAGGVAVKVGAGASCASARLADPASLRDWLARSAAALAPGRPGEPASAGSPPGRGPTAAALPGSA